MTFREFQFLSLLLKGCKSSLEGSVCPVFSGRTMGVILHLPPEFKSKSGTLLPEKVRDRQGGIYNKLF